MKKLLGNKKVARLRSKLCAELRHQGEPLDYLEMNSSAAKMFLSWLLCAFGDHLFILDMMLWAALTRTAHEYSLEQSTLEQVANFHFNNNNYNILLHGQEFDIYQQF